jgi:hypothetical protein
MLLFLHLLLMLLNYLMLLFILLRFPIEFIMLINYKLTESLKEMKLLYLLIQALLLIKALYHLKLTLLKIYCQPHFSIHCHLLLLQDYLIPFIIIIHQPFISLAVLNSQPLHLPPFADLIPRSHFIHSLFNLGFKYLTLL